ncbi:quaternary amine ABC transporter ATP-binding protein [Desulfonatronovibrio hydrogenovorans]|uniref:quaternary amine ABC transporter ATP-binding protein n=1 Tax=Desulfonatronovibrio hydrogenovorans TaxID=53245 RepID=UPI0004907CBC|nr:glycine betaine/L-proline ABC transporter ATP-binding protein [Desulfonatronovibrio hydrogenovorans]
MEKIVLKNVCKIFGDSPKKALAMLKDGQSKDQIQAKTGAVVGVNNASFDVKEGEIVVVMGLSGSGKSTLVRCINRLFEPTSGEILVDGQDVRKLSKDQLRQFRREKFGMVFQNFALFPHRTVIHNVEFGLEIQGAEQGLRREKAEQALELVGLKGWGEKFPSELSGGMQQRVGLARALALDPDILLMDEAFSALDPLIRRDMQDELISLQQTMRKTIVFISHDLDEALKLGDRIVLMKDGAVVQIGTPEDILMNPSNEYVAKFVEEVDITKVLTAETIMKKSQDVAYLTADGPRTAMRKMKNNAIASLFVLDKDNSLQGIVFANEVAKLIEKGEKNLDSVIHRDISTVSPDTSASDLFAVMQDISYPVAVVDENNKLKGIIVKGILMAAIAERGGNI